MFVVQFTFALLYIVLYCFQFTISQFFLDITDIDRETCTVDDSLYGLEFLSIVLRSVHLYNLQFV